MKHTSFHFRGLWAVLAAIGLLTLTASARTVTPRHGGSSRLDNADPLAVKSLIAHDIGNVRMTLSNWGEDGNPDGTPGYKGFEFPINSGNDFLFSSGVWVGAIVNGVMHVSTTTDGDNGTNEFYPVHIGAVPSSRVARSADWFVTSKNFATFAGFDYVQGAKSADDDGDWTEADHRANPNYDDGRPTNRPSDNYDGGKGLIGFDDDGDGLIDEEITNGLDDDGDGKIDEDTDSTGDANHDGNCSYDPERHIDEDPAGDISHDYVDNDFDGLVDMDDPDYDGDLVVGSDDDDGDGEFDEDGVARGVQEYYCVYQDDIEARYVGSPNDPHVPLKLEILQRSYAFPEAYAADFILIDYRIRSRNPLPLENVFVALFSDPDVAAAGEGGDAASADDYNFYDPSNDSSNVMMIQGDDSLDADGFGPGYFAMRVVQTPAPLSELRVNFHNFDRLTGGDPEFDPAKYIMISSSEINPPSAALGDKRMLLGFGPDATSGFRLLPGQELPITVAYVTGMPLEQTRRNAEWALRMFLNDFQGPSAPSTPDFALDVYGDMVRIRWLPNAESSVDVISQRPDFEGYIIERSTDQIRWQTIASYDRIDRLDTLHDLPDYPDSFTVYPGRREFEWQNYNLGMPGDSGRPGQVHRMWDTTAHDSVVDYYSLEDRDLIPGHTYYYAVRAFDKGEVGAGILYSGRTGNVQTALIARRADTGAPHDLSGVYVFPNPYKGSHAGEEGGQVNPTKGLLEYPRKLFFMGLPPATRQNECVIRIFTLGGDHLTTLQHTNGTEFDQWDMITKNSQEIVSGIYYYTVEYGSKQFIDKFVVIK